MDNKLQYRWESELTPEEVRERIRTLAKPMDHGWQFKQGGAMYYRFSDDEGFCLGYADFYAAEREEWYHMRRHAFFYGTIRSRNGKTVIEGDLSDPREPQIPISGVFAVILAVIAAVLTILNVVRFGLKIGLFLSALILLFFAFIFRGPGSASFGLRGSVLPSFAFLLWDYDSSDPRNQAVLDLIENNLLKR